MSLFNGMNWDGKKPKRKYLSISPIIRSIASKINTQKNAGMKWEKKCISSRGSQWKSFQVTDLDTAYRLEMC